MAEFKLGRIRFVWKDTWAGTTTYIKDDVVRFGGKTYICILGHTSNSNFYTDLSASKWELASDGQEWKNTWAGTTIYKIGDIVKWGGVIYICKTGHTSQTYLEEDQNKWDAFASAFDWKNTWTTGIYYKVGDIVKYGATIYRCKTSHTSAATSTLGLEDNQSSWDIVNRSFDYLGDWSASSVRYKLNDVVKWGGGLWICTTYHTSMTGFNESNWAQFVEGLEFEDTFDSGTVYQPGDVVTYGGYSYVSKTNNTNKTPSTNTSDWDILSTGFNFQGEWTLTTFYKIGSVVRHNGYTYLCILDNTADVSHLPENTTYWQRLNSGFKWLSTWASGFAYELGDSVRYGINSYVCIASHTSSAGDRPDVDVLGNYWNQLTGGAEVSALTTQGDILYYGASGATRLPIGSEGQILKVSNGNVAWDTFGEIPNVWYVATTGVDDIDNGYGVTVDRPFKTVRYACQNVTGPATIFIKTGTFAEVLPIIVPANVALVGDELRSTVITAAGSLVSSADTPYSLIAMLRLKAIIDDVIVNTPVTPSAGNTVTQNVLLTAGSGAAATSAQALVQNAYDWIDYYINAAGSAPGKTGTYVASTVPGYVAAAAVLSANRSFIATEVVEYMKAQYFIYDSVTCSRDIGLIIDTTGYDLVLGTNYNRVATGLAQSENMIISNQMAKSVSVITKVKDLALVESINSDTTVTAVFTEILDILQNGAGNADALTWTTPSNAVAGAANAKALLVSNRQFLIDEITAYMNTNYSTFWGTLSAGQKTAFALDFRYIVDALCYDVLYGGNSASVRVAESYYTGTTTLVPGEQLERGAAIERLRVVARDVILNTTVVVSAGNSTSQVTDVPNPGTATQQTQIDTLLNAVHEVVSYGIAYLPTAVYPDISWGSTNAKNDRLALLAAKSTIQSSTITYINTAVGSGGLGGFSFKTDSCYRDVVEYVKAIEYDLIYTGNYKTLLAADWYVGAVTGSSLRNMFYLRNGTGVRNMTLSGLNGVLGSDNAYGTKRPSAGAYVSLDPGYGTGDITVHITSKSPYVQNVSTFGTGCVGMKIDGDIHGSGNKSIVANDFTQILSDGIGMWITNLARAELVSVFTYYCHIGYLAENGGKIRATNGNNSYGKFGAVSEGVDATETPTTALVNNQKYEAVIGYTFPSGDGIYRLEYSNAGTAYTDTPADNIFTFSGTGINAVAAGDEIRDNAVYQVRLLTSGADYVTASNTAQNGTTSQITLAGSDLNGSGVYVGMRVVITAGKGVGQYGYISAYNSGSKVATVLKETDGSSGWDHIVPGTTITTLDSTSVYSIEPRITFPAPTYTVSSGTIQSGNWAASAHSGGKFVAVASGGVASYSTNGTSWTAATGFPSASYTAAAAGKILTVDYYVAVASGTRTSVYSTNGSTWVSNATGMPASANWSGVAYGNSRFVAIQTGGTATAISTDGSTWSSGGSFNTSTTWTAITYGNGRFVAVSGAGSASTRSAYSTDNGVSWTEVTSLPSANWTSVTYGNGRFVAVATGGTQGAYSTDGVTWTSTTLPASGTWKEVRYGQGTFFAIAGYGGSATTVGGSSTDGITWTSRALSSAAWSTISFGNPSGNPIWALSATGGTTAASFTNITPAQVRGTVQTGQLATIRIIDPGSGYTSTPTMTVTDPNNTVEATWTVRTGDGALANPSFTNRGTGYTTASAEVTGVGYADNYQDGYYVNVQGMTAVPLAGSNVIFDGNSQVYKLVTITEQLGTGPYTARLQLSPQVTIPLAPEHNTNLTIRYRYSQCRLTGHDFLSIGTDNFTNTNYPGTPLITANQDNEAVESNGGRVFFTSTDQDGNFRVGDLFSVEQATGKSTLNANAFALSGLQELQLGSVTLGSSNTAINEFSTDATFYANSDSIVPTQKAIKSYISSQIGGGGSNLNVNTLTAGVITIGANTISTSSGGQINFAANVNFTKGVDGSPLAINYFLLRN